MPSAARRSDRPGMWCNSTKIPTGQENPTPAQLRALIEAELVHRGFVRDPNDATLFILNDGALRSPGQRVVLASDGVVTLASFSVPAESIVEVITRTADGTITNEVRIVP